MKIAVDKEQREFFGKNGFIEFEDFLPAEAISSIRDAVRRTLALRLKSDRIDTLSPSSLFHCGRDLFRDDGDLKKKLSSQLFSTTVNVLTHIRPLRLAIDQYFCGESCQSFFDPFETSHAAYSAFIGEKVPLKQLCPIQGVAAAAILCLKGCDIHHEGDSGCFPLSSGNVTIVAADHVVDLSLLKQRPDAEYLLVVYAGANAVYIKQPADPLYHRLRGVGYSFGDKLKDNLNPIVLR